MTRRDFFVLLVILVVAAGVRFGFTAALVGFDAPLKGDEANYQRQAEQLAAGEGFVTAWGAPTAYGTPGYPAILAVALRLEGDSPRTTRLLQLRFGVLIVLLTFLLARALFGVPVALIAAALVAVNPFLVFISGYGLTENPYTLFVLTALCLVTAKRMTPAWRLCVAGVALGLATLVRPTGFAMALWIAAALAVVAHGLWPRARAALLVFGVTWVAFVLPWQLRNLAVMGEWVGLSTHAGTALYQSNNIRAYDVPEWRGGVAPLEALPEWERLKSLPEVEYNRLALAEGRRFMLENPGRAARMVGWRFVRMWRLKSDVGLSGIASGWWFRTDTTLGKIAASFDVGLIYAVVALPFFLFGVVVTRRRWRELLGVYGVVLVHTATVLVVFGSLRARVPVEPVIAVFAAAGVMWCFRRLRPGRDSSTPSPQSP